MVTTLVAGGVGIVASSVSAWVSYIFTKRKYKVEVDNATIQGMKDSLEFYKTLSDDNKQRLEELRQENLELRRELEDLRRQMIDLTLHLTTNYAFLSKADLRAKQLTTNTTKDAKTKNRLDKTENIN